MSKKEETSKNNNKYNIVKKDNRTFYFIGVTTAGSSIMRLFPQWMEELGCLCPHPNL